MWGGSVFEKWLTVLHNHMEKGERHEGSSTILLMSMDQLIDPSPLSSCHQLKLCAHICMSMCVLREN